LPYEIYFGKESQPWGGGGVAFLDAEKPSVVLGKMYLVSEEQFEDIHEQEGKWYNRTLEFKCDQINDWPVKSFTHDTRCKENPPSLTYRGVIQSGMEEMLKDERIFQSPAAILRGCL
jgi:hypothetical protein